MTDTATLPDLPDDDTLEDRYELLEPIGRGSQGATFRARDRDAGDIVAVKRLDLQTADDWKAVELFEREADVLASLDHPGIPTHIDHFTRTIDGRPCPFLVREFVEGDSLADLVDDGHHLEEDEVWAFIDEMLGILSYLHSREHPVLHRDLKPSNVVRRPDGTHVVVDFGSVHRLVEQEGSTVIGTRGYMPLEQLMGRTAPASDLYAVGATALHLLSHRHPGEMPVREMKPDFHDRIHASRPLEEFLDRLLEPAVEDRLDTAEQARQLADRLRERPADLPARKPPDDPPLQSGESHRSSRVAVELDDDRQSTVRIGRDWGRVNIPAKSFALGIGAIAFGGIAALAGLLLTTGLIRGFDLMTGKYLGAHWMPNAAQLLGASMGLLAGLLLSVRQIANDDVRFSTWELRVDDDGFELLERDTLRKQFLASGDLTDLQGLGETRVAPPEQVDGPPETALVLETDDDRHVFAHGLPLEDREAILAAVDAATHRHANP